MEPPIYQKIINQLKEEIKSMEVNSAIPSERELAQRYTASRMTVRKAILKLVEDGLLYRNGNKGTFVANHKLHKDSLITSVMEEFRSQIDMHILYYDIKKGDPEITKCLEITDQDNYLRIVRLNKQSKKPTTIEEIYIVQRLHKQDIYNVNEVLAFSESIETGSICRKFIPMVVPVQYANLLELPIGTPIILTKSTIFTKDGNVYAFIKGYNNPNNKEIEMTF